MDVLRRCEQSTRPRASQQAQCELSASASYNGMTEERSLGMLQHLTSTELPVAGSTTDEAAMLGLHRGASCQGLPSRRAGHADQNALSFG